MAGRHVALLRGINVGRAKRVAMADLRALVEGLGYGDVRTLLNSGNVVFTTGVAPRTAAARIEKVLAAQLGVASRVTVFTAREIAAAVTENPLLDVADNPSRLLIVFLRDPGDRPRLAPLMKQKWNSDALALGPRVAYMWCANGILESRLAEAVARVLGDAGTARNWSTLLKLHALTCDPR
jgi:uncharacterized protein (DUF1697 family)